MFFLTDMFSNLAPRLGHTSFSTVSVGSAELRGGKINWGSLGSSISNALRTTGRYLGQKATKFANSKTFSDIKAGIQDSGLVRNVAGLAGQTLNSLVDIGRFKVQSELQKLRDRVLNTIPADQLAQILLNYQQTHDQVPMPVTPGDAIPLPPPPPAAIEPRKRPYVEEIDDNPNDAEVVIDTPALSTVPAIPAPPPTVAFVPSIKRPRIRGTGESEWQTHLNKMLGQGVRYTSTNQCY